jgi:hypothetical protein
LGRISKKNGSTAADLTAGQLATSQALPDVQNAHDFCEWQTLTEAKRVVQTHQLIYAGCLPAQPKRYETIIQGKEK